MVRILVFWLGVCNFLNIVEDNRINGKIELKIFYIFFYEMRKL